MTAREALRRGAERLRAAGVENPGLESRLLLAHAVGTSLESLLGDPCQEVDPQHFDEFVARRASISRSRERR
jgi:methylase of polypeptide subunit release factors